jgi:hypothetical protein
MFTSQYISCRTVVFGFMSLFYLKSINESLLLLQQESVRPVNSCSKLQQDNLPIWPQQFKLKHCFDYPVNLLYCSNLRQGLHCSGFTVAFAPALRNLLRVLDPIELFYRSLVLIFSHPAGGLGKYTSLARVTLSHVTIQGMNANYLN